MTAFETQHTLPTRLSGYDPQPNGLRMVWDRDCMVPMRDGVSLCVDIYRPDSPERFPALLAMTEDLLSDLVQYKSHRDKSEMTPVNGRITLHRRDHGHAVADPAVPRGEPRHSAQEGACLSHACQCMA